jgi:hypothetical protein
MHRHKRFRHGPRLSRPWNPFQGVFWLFVLVMLFSGGKWWPAIFILIGLGILFNSIFREDRPAEAQEPTPQPYVPPMTPPAQPGPVAAPAESARRSDLLPAACPHCGGPIRAYEVKWTGTRSAACPYCGSNLPMKAG